MSVSSSPLSSLCVRSAARLSPRVHVKSNLTTEAQEQNSTHLNDITSISKCAFLLDLLLCGMDTERPVVFILAANLSGLLLGSHL